MPMLKLALIGGVVRYGGAVFSPPQDGQPEAEEPKVRGEPPARTLTLAKAMVLLLPS